MEPGDTGFINLDGCHVIDVTTCFKRQTCVFIRID